MSARGTGRGSEYQWEVVGGACGELGRDWERGGACRIKAMSAGVYWGGWRKLGRGFQGVVGEGVLGYREVVDGALVGVSVFLEGAEHGEGIRGREVLGVDGGWA